MAQYSQRSPKASRSLLNNRSATTLITAALLITCVVGLATAQDSGSSTPSMIVVKAGTRLMLDLDTPMNTASTRIDDIVWFTLRDAVKVEGRVAMPRGTPIRGSVIVVKPAIVNGKNQRTELQIRLEEIPLDSGGGYGIAADPLKVQGEKPSSGVNAQAAIGSAMQGALLGGAISRSGRGAGIGAAAAVLATVIAGKIQSSGGPTSDVDLPSGSIFEAKLERNLNIPDNAALAKAVPKAPPAKTPDAPIVTIADSFPATSASAPPAEIVGATAPAEPGVPAFDSLSSDENASTDATNSSSVAVLDEEKRTGEAAGAAASVTTIKPTVLSVDVNLIQVDALVRDRAGKPMGSLRQEDFRVFEDGVEKEIQFFSRDQQPLAVALVIDRSGSVAPLMNEVQSAAYQALKLLKTGDQVCLFSFAGSVELLEELTADRQRVANRIGRIKAGGGTAIVDGISEALRYLETTAPDSRRVIILISDNIEGRSRTSAEQAIAFALETEASVYSVKVGNSVGGSILGIPIPGLPPMPVPGVGADDPVKTIIKETGGEIVDATGGASITAALTSVIDRLKLRYTLSYAGIPVKPGAKSGFHRIQVQLVSRFGKPDVDYTIHARSGYYDSASGTR
ncbi:MAG TPA: VWA domain-containing protein [Terriglobia bacterium]|nr:VWA domain-containing protein [Terriglobia bacterium]